MPQVRYITHELAVLAIYAYCGQKFDLSMEIFPTCTY